MRKGRSQARDFSKAVRLAATGLALAAIGFSAQAQGRDSVGYNSFGAPGLVDMPTAEMSPDGRITGTLSQIGDSRRTTLSFQILPRLSGSFRYSAISNFEDPFSVDDVYYDRSFDLRYQLLTEGYYRPSVVIGFQDFIGTAFYGGEYIVATKTLAPGLKLTGGLGWGRFGGVNTIGSTGTRPETVLGEGGVPTYDRWFRGDVGAFGGLSYAPNDRLRFKLEYSSDDYALETRSGGFERESPWNFGVDYMFRNGGQLSAYYAYGSEFGAQFTFWTNPKTIGVPGGAETAPLPVQVRAAGAASDLGWATEPARRSAAKQSLTELAATDGLIIEGLQLEPRRATVRLLNPRYNAPAQAIGRTARAMTRALPASVEEFVIVPVVNGMPMSAVTLRRSDLEALEHEAADEILARTAITDGFRRAPAPDPGLYPKFTWNVAPYLQFSVFDPENPVRADIGVRATAKAELTPGLVLSGSLTKRLNGDLDEIAREDLSGLPRVRTDYGRFAAAGDPAIEYLQLAAYGRPGRDLYSRFTFGYLESMYAGASAELLWKPVSSRFALGAEINYIQRRDFDQLFGLQDMVTVNPIDPDDPMNPENGRAREIPNVNGHISAYYDFGNGFHGQLDVGRYLAGDYGATISLDREFANGWRIGAYATVTDASAEDFGEGSFDKGLRFSIPLTSFLGQPSREVNQVNIQSLSRDGGARLNVRGRLYEQVRDYHQPEAAKSWGRFWR